jgi:hypothetical protein
LRVTDSSLCDAAAAIPKSQSHGSVVASGLQFASPAQGHLVTESGRARTKLSSLRFNRFQFWFCSYRWRLPKPSIPKPIRASAVAQHYTSANSKASSPTQRRTCQPNRATQKFICALSSSGLHFNAPSPNPVVSGVWSLTLRSSRAPTAGHQARAMGAGHIFHSPGLASHRCCRLSSNVRPHKMHFLRVAGLSVCDVSFEILRAR